MNGIERRAWWSWASIGLLAVLCLILILLQYRWTGEVARAEQERLKTSLQSTVDRFSREFNSELAAVVADLIPRAESIDETGVDRAYAERYARRRDPLIRRLALAVPAGPGIPAAERDRIFDPFFRGNRAIKDQVHGTGLGLNLVKRIIEAHGGSIAVVSEPGQGSEFVIRIPAAPPELQNELAHSLG